MGGTAIRWLPGPHLIPWFAHSSKGHTPGESSGVDRGVVRAAAGGQTDGGRRKRPLDQHPLPALRGRAALIVGAVLRVIGCSAARMRCQWQTLHQDCGNPECLQTLPDVCWGQIHRLNPVEAPCFHTPRCWMVASWLVTAWTWHPSERLPLTPELGHAHTWGPSPGAGAQWPSPGPWASSTRRPLPGG